VTLPANLNVYGSALFFVLGAYLFALYVGLIVWTYRDIKERSRDVLAHILAPLLVAVFNLPGLLVYALLRPRNALAEEYERSLMEEAVLQDLAVQRVCPGCGRRVESDFLVCPHCHHQLRLRCVGCGRLLQPEWDVCPYCGIYREGAGHPPEDGQMGQVSDDQMVYAAPGADDVRGSERVREQTDFLQSDVDTDYWLRTNEADRTPQTPRSERG